MTTATIKRSLGANDVAPALRQPRRYSSFSIFLVTLAFLLASASVPPFIKPWIRSRELNVPHQGIETQMRLAPGSYRVDARTRFENLSPPLPIVAGSTGNVVAVLLNWSRFENVRRIVSLLCGSELDLIMKRVLVWNNNPKPLKYLDFLPTSCPEEKLQIINSAENVYFYARYLGCSQSDAEYCFIQDDDYLVLPEVIQALYAHITKVEWPSSVHLLPPHEHLSSDLRAVYKNKSALHTSFSWLGYGTLMHRSLVSEFLSLLQNLNVSFEEAKMADNYFTILRNRPPMTWFDQGIELGGGQPFTVGPEGDERNKMHILKASYYLDSLLDDDGSAYRRRMTDGKIPFTSLDTLEGSPISPLGKAPCVGRPCLFETTVSLLPNDIRHSCEHTQDMLDLEEQNLQILGDDKMHYLSYPPSFAVDGKPDTAFRSLRSASRGDTITLDMLRDVSTLYTHTQIAILVDSATEHIIRACTFQTSSNGDNWTTLFGELLCVRVDLAGIGKQLVECSIGAGDRGSNPKARYFRARLTGDRKESWAIYEIWIRGYDD